MILKINTCVLKRILIQVSVVQRFRCTIENKSFWDLNSPTPALDYWDHKLFSGLSSPTLALDYCHVGLLSVGLVRCPHFLSILWKTFKFSLTIRGTPGRNRGQYIGFGRAPKLRLVKTRKKSKYFVNCPENLGGSETTSVNKFFLRRQNFWR